MSARAEGPKAALQARSRCEASREAELVCLCSARAESMRFYPFTHRTVLCSVR